MARKRLLVNAIFLLLLPIIVAWLGLSAWTAAALVAVTLMWRWASVLSGILAPEKAPDIVLESIAISHYVEKVRWCMDRLGIDYTERPSGGTLRAYFTGHTVPQLRVRTGIMQSVIGNSPEILRFLWGQYSAPLGATAAFLEPTPQRLEFERRLDRYGRYQQVWVYFHLAEERELTLRLWGGSDPQTPAWQRAALRMLFPVLRALIQRSFRISDAQYAKAVQTTEELLSDVDTRLADGRKSILGGDTINYTDIAFAALSGPWLMPAGFGGGAAEACRIEREDLPQPMQADVRRWVEDYPRATRFIRRLYEEERITTK
jgi:glutathione S-transferase